MLSAALRILLTIVEILCLCSRVSKGPNLTQIFGALLYVKILLREEQSTNGFELHCPDSSREGIKKEIGNISSTPYSSKKYPAGFLRTSAISNRVSLDGNYAPVS